jgi:hypothetical protein
MGVKITLTDGTSRELIEYNEFSNVVFDKLLDLNIQKMVKEEVELQTEASSGVAKPDITVYLFEGTDPNSLEPAEGKEFTHGDFAIGQTVIKETEPKKYSRTAYIYNVDHWEALNGNYNANNIYFDNDIEITKEIGYITLDQTGAGKIPAKDKNLVEVFGEMFAQDKDPVVSQPKINSFTFSNAGKSFEVGTKLTNLNFAASFYAGNYQYGPEDTGIIPSWEIKQGNNIISQEASGTIDELVINDSTNYVLKAIASYEQGAIPLTFKQKEKADLRIAAGSVEATTNAITGYRKYYYGPIYSKIANPATDLTSELIKGLLNKSTSNCNKTTKITWKAADYKDIVGYIIAVPANNKTVISTVNLVSNSNQVITDTYKSYVTTEKICGSGEDAGVNYNVWLYQPNSLGTDEEHSITFKSN